MLPPPLPSSKPRSLPVEIASTLGAYVVGQIKIGAILVAVYALGFALLGVPLWALIALLCGLLHLVPIFGSVIGLAIAELAMLAGDGDVYRCLGVLALWVVIEAIEGIWLTPKILGKRLQLSPLTVFFAVTAGGALFGFFGVLLAVPVAAVLAVLYRAFQRRRVANQIAGSSQVRD